MAKRKSATDLTPEREKLAYVLDRISHYRAVGIPRNAGRVLGIDPGTVNIAFAFLAGGQDPITSKVDLPKFENISDTVRVVEEIVERWIVGFGPINLIVKEGPAHGAKFGVVNAGRVQYAIERIAFELDVPLMTLAPQTMRAYLGAAGRGKTKSDTKLAIYKKFGYEFATEDETDAYGLARCGMSIASGEYETPSDKAARVKREKAAK